MQGPLLNPLCRGLRYGRLGALFAAAEIQDPAAAVGAEKYFGLDKIAGMLDQRANAPVDICSGHRLGQKFGHAGVARLAYML